MTKHLARKSFSVFNAPPPNPIEHTKTFLGQMFYFFLIKYIENVFLSSQNFLYKNLVSFVNKGNCIQ